MSQAKVDRYKDEKKNRKKNMKNMRIVSKAYGPGPFYHI